VSPVLCSLTCVAQNHSLDQVGGAVLLPSPHWSKAKITWRDSRESQHRAWSQGVMQGSRDSSVPTPLGHLGTPCTEGLDLLEACLDLQGLGTARPLGFAPRHPWKNINCCLEILKSSWVTIWKRPESYRTKFCFLPRLSRTTIPADLSFPSSWTNRPIPSRLTICRDGGLSNIFAQPGLKLQSSWSPPLKSLGLQAWATATGSEMF
jgi:hypothetical protein